MTIKVIKTPQDLANFHAEQSATKILGELRELKKEENIYTALLRFQTENKWLVVKDSNNPFFKSKYASLEAVHFTCRDKLKDCGIVVIQQAITSEHGAGCKTILVHANSGTSIESELILPYAAKIDPQAAGSCIRYARRYSLEAMLGLVAADEDDDANYASGNTGTKATENPKIQVARMAPDFIIDKGAKQYALKGKPEDKPHTIKTPLSEDEIPEFTAVKKAFPDSEEIKIRFKYDIDKAPTNKLATIENYIREMAQNWYVNLDEATGIVESEGELPKLKNYQINLE